jgi:hypothetical protein
VLDTRAHVAALAPRIRKSAVDTEVMPLGNPTGMTKAERARRLLLWSLRLRALVLRREEYRAGVRFLSSGNARQLLA